MSVYRVCGTALLSAFLILALLTGHISAQEDRVLVVVTAGPLASVVKEVGGEYVDVRSILPPGADPHSYEPSAQELLSLISGASLIVMTGPHHLPVEERIEELSRKGLIRARVLDYRDYQREGLRLLEIDGSLNPHGYFFSLSGLRAIAKACAGELSKLMPDKSEYFKQRLDTYLGRLALIEDSVRRLNVHGVRVALADPALQYIADDLGLDVEAILRIEHGVEPSPKEVAEIVELSREGRVSLVLLSDIGLIEVSAIMTALEENKVSYVLIPLLSFSNMPELAPVSAASIVKSRLQPGGSMRGAGSLSDAFLLPSLVANVVLALLLILLILRVRRHG